MKTLIEWIKRHKRIGTTMLAVLLTISVTAAITPSILSTNQTGGGLLRDN